jgi:hypothetical protein
MRDIRPEAVTMLRALALEVSKGEAPLTLDGLAQMLEDHATAMLMLMSLEDRREVLADWPGGMSPVLRYPTGE